MPLYTSIHQNQILANMSVRYANKRMDLIGSKVLPIIAVAKKTDDYYIYNKKDAYTIPDMKIGRKSKAYEATWNTSTSSYTCEGYALEDFIPDEDYKNVDSPPLKIERDTVEDLTDKLLLGYEKRVADLVFSNTTITQTTAVAAADRWDDPTSEVMPTVRTAFDGCFIQPNVCVMGYEVWSALKNHPDIVERVKYTSSDAVTTEAVARLFEVDQVLVGRAKYNTANPGQTASYSYVWGKSVLFAYVSPRISLKAVSLGYTMSFSHTGGARGWLVQRRRDDTRGLTGGNVLKVVQSVDEKIVASDVAYLLTTVVN